MEYAITGKVGADGSMDELDAYLQIFSASVVLKQGKRNDAKVIDRPLGSGKGAQPPREQPTTVRSSFQALVDEIGLAASKIIADPAVDSSGQPSLFGPPVDHATTQQTPSTHRLETDQHVDLSDGDLSPAEDDETLNPFAHSYQEPYGNSSMMSSAYSAKSEANEVTGAILTACNDHLSGGAYGQPDSPVSLGEYECLELDAIPNYMAFKSSALKTRQQRSKEVRGGFPQVEMNRSIASIASDVSDSNASSESDSNAARSRHDELFPLPDLRSRQQAPVMDLTYSYDFARETQFNPFGSSAVALLDNETEPSVPEIPSRVAAESVAEDEPARGNGANTLLNNTTDPNDERLASTFGNNFHESTSEEVASSVEDQQPRGFYELSSGTEPSTVGEHTRPHDETTLRFPIEQTTVVTNTVEDEGNLFG